MAKSSTQLKDSPTQPTLKAVQKQKVQEVTRLLDDAEREEMIKSLVTLGFTGGDVLNDLEIIQKLRELALVKNTDLMNAKVATESEGLADKIRAFSADSTLKNDDFIYRLITMNVHRLHLQCLSDEDSTLTDREIWERIRESGIETVDNTIFARQFREPNLKTRQPLVIPQ